MAKTFCCKIFVVIVGLALFSGSLVFAVPTIENGDFSTPGLSGWTVEYGTVTDGGGYALFEEDSFELSSTLSQEFTIPALALELSFDVELSAVPGGDDFGFPPDAFTASLLDPVTFDPLISNPGYTDYYFVDNQGLVETVATVTGNTVSLDVSGLRGLDALLSFDLWGGDDGMLTSVSVDNVNVSVIPTPGALLLAGIGTGLVGFLRRTRIGKIV